MALTAEQIKQLSSPIDPRLIRVLRTTGTPSYLPGHVVMEAANRIWGYDGWGYSVDQQSHEETPTGIVYSALVTVTVVGCVAKQDVGTEVASNQREGQAPSALQRETAIKGAVTSGIKRALRSFGDQMGLQLYDHDSDIDGEWTAWQRRRLADLLAQHPDAAATLGERQISDKALGAAIAKLEARGSEHLPPVPPANVPGTATRPSETDSLRDELAELLLLFPDAAAKLKGRTLSDKAVADGVAKLRLRAEAEPARWVGAVSKLLEEYAVALPTQQSEIDQCRTEYAAGMRLMPEFEMGPLTTAGITAQLLEGMGRLYDAAVERWPALFDEQTVEGEVL